METLERKIIDYCDGVLQGEELEAFELALQSNTDLQKQVERQKEIVLAIQSEKLLTTWRSISQERPRQQNSSRFKRILLPIVLVAAALALIMVLRPIFLSNDSTNLDSIFYPDPGLITPMSSVTEYEFYDGMVEYKLENYDEALQKWEGETLSIGADTLSYFRAMAYLNKRDLDKAKNELTKFQSTNSTFRNKANWYMIYILIEEGRTDEAISLFQNIPRDYPNYTELQSYFENQ